MRTYATTALLLVGLLTSGCMAILSDPLGRKNSLEDMQRRYTELIRWGELEKAGVFVHPDAKAEFNALAAAFAGLRVTDYEIGNINLREENKKATVTVTYRGYSQATLIEKPVRENQEWEREGSSNDWTVRPSLTEVVQTLSGTPARTPAAAAPAKAAH